jgi:hypothetical protein
VLQFVFQLASLQLLVIFQVLVFRHLRHDKKCIVAKELFVLKEKKREILVR